MGSVDLEKYKSAWKNESDFGARKLSANELTKFLKASSKSIVVFFRVGLVFDIILKVALLVSLFVLIFLVLGQTLFSYIDLFITAIILSGIGWQINVLRKIPNDENKNLSAVAKLKCYISFYYKYYISSIYVGATSGALFFIIGSTFYLRFKYHKIPQFQIDDFVVMSLGILLSYGLSAFVQLKYNEYRISQLEQSLKEIENDTINESSIKTYQPNRKKITLIFGIALVVGLTLFLLLIQNS